MARWIILASLMPAVATSAALAASSFEVASVKSCRADTAVRKNEGQNSPDSLRLPCQTLKSLIDWAYISFANGHFHPTPYVLSSGGPAWIDSALYEVQAKAAGPEAWGTINGPMLQALLEERFKLKIHRETRQVPVFTLSVIRGGLHLDRAKKQSCLRPDFDRPPAPLAPGQPFPRWCGMMRGTGQGYDAEGATMDDLCTFLSASIDLGRQVVNSTRIPGAFDLHLDLSRDDLKDDSITAVQVALKKLGLKLEPARGTAEFLVIDSVERPSEN